MADGKVVIDTSLNNDGIAEGLKEITGALGGLKNVLGNILDKLTQMLERMATGTENSSASFLNLTSQVEQAAAEMQQAAESSINLADTGQTVEVLADTMTDVSAEANQASRSIEQLETKTEQLCKTAQKSGEIQSAANQKAWSDVQASVKSTGMAIEQNVAVESVGSVGRFSKAMSAINGTVQSLGETLYNHFVSTIEQGNEELSEYEAKLAEIDSKMEQIRAEANEMLPSNLGGLEWTRQGQIESITGQNKQYQDLSAQRAELASLAEAATKAGLASRVAGAMGKSGWVGLGVAAAIAAQQIKQELVQGVKNVARTVITTVKNAATKAIKAVINAASKMAKAAVISFGKLIKSVSKLSHRTNNAQKSTNRFITTLKGVVAGALIFGTLSRAITSMTTYFKNAVMSSGQFRNALANLKGAASTAAAPIVQALTPALTMLANAAATVFSYISRLFSLLTGKSVASMQASAKATDAYSQSVNGATDAAKELAEANNTLGIDELNVVQADTSNSGSSGGGSGTDVTPNYDFTGQSDFLDSILQSIESGDWYGVGALVAQKLNDVMGSIDWPSTDKKARQWVGNMVDTLNGFVHNIDWSLLGGTLANGLNVALHCYDDFFQKFDWTGLGRGLGTGLNQMVNTLDWQTVGRALTDKLKALLEMFHGFVITFDFASLGSNLAVAIMAAVNNIDWVQFAMDLNNFAFGLLEGLQNLIRGIDWAGMGATVREMLASIDWAGIVSSLAYSLGQLAQGIWIFLEEALAGVGQKLGSYFTGMGENCIDGFLEGMWNLLYDIGGWLHDNLIAPLLKGIKEPLGIHSPSRVFAEIGQFLIEGLFGGLLEKWHLISGFFTEKFDWVKDKVKTTWKNVQSNTSEMWESISSSLKNTLSNLGERFGDTWAKLQTSTNGSWSGMTSTIKGAVNVIISFMNQLLSGAGNMINGLIDLLNKFSIDVPADVPIIGGTKFGFSMDHITVPQIPALAQGAVLPANKPFLAMVGDQKRGTNVEAPLETIQQALAAVLAQTGSVGGVVRRPIEIKLDRQVLYRAMVEEEERQGVKIGGAFANAY